MHPNDQTSLHHQIIRNDFIMCLKSVNQKTCNRIKKTLRKTYANSNTVSYVTLIQPPNKYSLVHYQTALTPFRNPLENCIDWNLELISLDPLVIAKRDQVSQCEFVFGEDILFPSMYPVLFWSVRTEHFLTPRVKSMRSHDEDGLKHQVL